jgi:hypothetical protein
MRATKWRGVYDNAAIVSGLTGSVTVSVVSVIVIFAITSVGMLYI